MGNNFSTIKERILYLAENVEVSKQIFFKNIKISYGNFTGDKKKRPINSDAIENILLMYPNTNPWWLILGNGEMLKDEISVIKKEQDNDYKELAESRKETIELQKEKIQTLEKELAKFKKAQEPNLHSSMVSESNLELGKSKEKIEKSK